MKQTSEECNSERKPQDSSFHVDEIHKAIEEIMRKSRASNSRASEMRKRNA